MTREQVIADVVQALIHGVTRQAGMDPRTAAEGAWYPGHPLTVDEIEQRIRHRRALLQHPAAA